MKALVKRYPMNAAKVEQNEVYLESAWHDWIDKNTGAPLTDENYGYALCFDVPENVELDANDFEITEREKEISDDMGEKVKVKYWSARYVGGVKDGA